VAELTNFLVKYNLSEAEFQECWIKGILVLDTKSILQQEKAFRKEGRGYTTNVHCKREEALKKEIFVSQVFASSCSTRLKIADRQ
jgi:hypothetical protein